MYFHVLKMPTNTTHGDKRSLAFSPTTQEFWVPWPSRAQFISQVRDPSFLIYWWMNWLFFFHYMRVTEPGFHTLSSSLASRVVCTLSHGEGALFFMLRSCHPHPPLSPHEKDHRTPCWERKEIIEQKESHLWHSTKETAPDCCLPVLSNHSPEPESGGQGWF